MKWFWYVARADELMIDLDGASLLEIAVKRIQREDGNGLKVDRIFVATSQTRNHFHMVVKLTRKRPAMERMIWQLYFMDHTYRTCKNMFRVLRKVRSPSLLIAPAQWRFCQPWRRDFASEFWRDADATCECDAAIHKDPRQIIRCPAHQKLRGFRNW